MTLGIRRAYWACLVAATVVACASNGTKPTQLEADRANQICTNQVNTDRYTRNSNWFSRWLACKQEHIMPLEIRLYPNKEAQIREMYIKLLASAWKVDIGFSKVETVYDEWDRMQDEIGMYRGVCVRRADGSQKCIDGRRSTIFMQTKDGDIVRMD